MQGVQIGLGRNSRVVGIKDSHQADDSAEECNYIDDGMDRFQVLLSGITESAVNENSCNITLIFKDLIAFNSSVINLQFP